MPIGGGETAGGGGGAMAEHGHAYLPSMSDAVVKAKTGKNWAGWFGALDKARAAKLGHRGIADILSTQHGLPGWWCQMVPWNTSARGLRVRHETPTGFSVLMSKTVATSLHGL